MIVKAAKRIFNFDKIFRSFSDLNFGVTFFGTQCISYVLHLFASLQVALYHCFTATSAQRHITCRVYLRVQELHVPLAYHGRAPAASRAANLSMETSSGSNIAITGQLMSLQTIFT